MPYNIEAVVNLSDDVFAFQMLGREKVTLVNYEPDLKKGYMQNIAYEELAGRILAINGDKNKFYSLVQDEDEQYLKIFQVKGNKL